MKIIGDVDYVMGYSRSGHYELTLDDEEYKEYKNLSEEDKKSWIEDGDFIVDNYKIDIGTITEIHEYEE